MTEGGSPDAQLPAELSADFDRFRAQLTAQRERDPRWTGLGSADALGTWREYGRLLYERSADLALGAKGDRDAIYTRHVLDSLNPLTLYQRPPASLLDIGSGGGL